MKSKGLSRVFAKTTVQKHQFFQYSAFFLVQLSHPYMTLGKTIALTRWAFVGKVMSLLFNMLSMLIIAFLPRSKRLLISWLQSPSAVILESKIIVCHCFHCFSPSLFPLFPMTQEHGQIYTSCNKQKTNLKNPEKSGKKKCWHVFLVIVACRCEDLPFPS